MRGDVFFERMVKKMSDDSSFFRGFFFGVLGGAVLGILFAPDEGKETRRKIAEKGKEAKGKAEELAHDVEKELGPLVKETSERIREVSEQVQEASGPVKESTKDKLSELEKELAQTRKRFFKGTE